MADITVDGITNAGGTGVFDKLMESINGQIETQYLNNRITGADYATVYLGSLQTALSQSIQFAMQEVLTESQVDSIIADTALKAKQLDIAGIEELAKQFEVDNLLPAQLIKLQKDTDVTERQMLETEATGAKQRILLDTEEEAKQYEVDNLLLVQLEKLEEEIDLLQTQDSELLLDGAKKRLIMDEQIETANKQQLAADAQIKSAYADRVLKDKQAAKLGLDNVMKTAEIAKQSNPNFVYTPNYEE